MSPNYYGMSPDAPAKALARFLTECEVQTPSGRSTVWQATTGQRMRTHWGDQMVVGLRLISCVTLPVEASAQASGGALQKAMEQIGLARFVDRNPR